MCLNCRLRVFASYFCRKHLGLSQMSKPSTFASMIGIRAQSMKEGLSFWHFAAVVLFVVVVFCCVVACCVDIRSAPLAFDCFWGHKRWLDLFGARRHKTWLRSIVWFIDVYWQLAFYCDYFCCCCCCEWCRRGKEAFRSGGFRRMVSYVDPLLHLPHCWPLDHWSPTSRWPLYFHSIGLLLMLVLYFFFVRITECPLYPIQASLLLALNPVTCYLGL